MSFLQFTLLIFFLFTNFNIIYSSTSFIAPIYRDETTNLYSILISTKTPLQSTELLLDLGGKYSWIDCSPNSYTSTTHHYIQCGSHECNSFASLACSNCFHPSGPGCHNNSCGLFPENPVIKDSILAQSLVDTIAMTTIDGNTFGELGVVPNFVFSCSDESLLRGLPERVSGLAGLSRFDYSLPSQVSKVYASPRIFALCLPSSIAIRAGAAFFNTAGPYYFSQTDLSSYLNYTPLILNPVGFTLITYYNHPSDEYFIGLTSIKLNGKPVPFNPSLLQIDNYGFGGTRLSTVTPYTTLHTSIYTPFIELYILEAKIHNVTVLPNPVSPFEVCFSESNMYDPVIDLVMHSEDVLWRVNTENSMVRVEGENGEIMWCLGFVDGGNDARTSVVIGGKQMEDNLLQFDLVSQRLGFTSSVWKYRISCGDFDFGGYY